MAHTMKTIRYNVGDKVIVHDFDKLRTAIVMEVRPGNFYLLDSDDNIEHGEGNIVRHSGILELATDDQEIVLDLVALDAQARTESMLDLYEAGALQPQDLI